MLIILCYTKTTIKKESCIIMFLTLRDWFTIKPYFVRNKSYTQHVLSYHAALTMCSDARFLRLLVVQWDESINEMIKLE